MNRPLAKVASLPALQKLKVVSLAIVVTALLWWGVVYVQVMNNTGFPFERTLPCLLYTSDRCSLAMALCRGSHFLGIQRYSAELLWLGTALAAITLAAEGLFNRTSREERQP